jgi:predicted DNA binding CopG/RHH family protein
MSTDANARARRAAIRAEYLDEEAAAAEAEAAENEQTVLSVRVPTSMADTLKARAVAEHLPTSALIRRLLARALQDGGDPVMTVAQVEDIARRILRESA